MSIYVTSPYHLARRWALSQNEYSGRPLPVDIRDEGEGFDPAKLPDPHEAANLEKASGRGVLLMRSFMDEVRFEDGGRSVTLVKRGHRENADGLHPG